LRAWPACGGCANSRSASYTNLRLSARDDGGAIMPPGMIMTYDTPGQSMRDMAAVDPRTVSYTAPPDARGDQPLEPRIENGVKVFDLDVSVIKWNILPYEQVMAYAFNHQVPGPRIRVTEGDRVRINVTNHLPEPTSVHWHGLVVPNAMDGPADITQKPIEPGQTYTYEFTTQQAGTYFYHTHKEPDRQQALGLYGALIIDPKDPSSIPAHDLEYTIELQEWLEREGYTYPAMLMEGGLPNFFTFFTSESHPFDHPWAFVRLRPLALDATALGLPGMPAAGVGRQELVETLGMSSILLQSGMLMGLLLLMIRR
jgi:manganese oxidase